MLRMLFLAAALGAVTLLSPGCGGDDGPAAPVQVTPILRNTFDNDLEGWQVDVTSIDWGKAQWASKGDGVIELDGVGDQDPGPNAWAWKSIALAGDARTLRYTSSAHDRGAGTGFLRVRLVDGQGASTTLLDWDELATGSEGFEFFEQTHDVSAWAGQTVTLYFELEDMDGGGNNQRYIGEVEVLR